MNRLGIRGRLLALLSLPGAWAAAGLAAAALAAGCSRVEKPAEKGARTQTLLVGNAAEPADLDPQSMSAFTDANIAYTLFEGLTTFDEVTSRPMPAAARSWEVSADGKVYTFHLRASGRWSDGDPVTASDFVFSFRRILTPSFGAGYSYMLWPILNARAYNMGSVTDFSKVGVRAVDPLTLRITLEQPTPYLPSLAAHSTWLPVHRATIERFGPFDQKGTLWTRPGNLVGNGPFTLSEWVPNGRIVVLRNPLYWDAAGTRLRRVEFYPIENSDAEELAFRAGQLHLTYALPISKIGPYRADEPRKLRIDPILSTVYLFINTTRAPFESPKLRKALSLGVDREAIVRDVLGGSRVCARCLTPPNCGGYTSRTAIADDLAQARRLLAEAGFPGGRGLPPIEVQSYANGESIRVLETIQDRWARDLGVHVTIQPLEQKTLFQNGQTQNYAIQASAWIADYPDPSTFLNTMVTGGGNNWAGWSNPDFDALITRAGQTADQGARLELFQRAEAILVDQAPLIPLYFDSQVHVIDPAVHGYGQSVMGFPNFKKIWLEP